MEPITTIRISETARVRVECDESRCFDDFGDWQGIEGAYSWGGPHRKWGKIYGEHEVKTKDEKEFCGYSQGEYLRIYHNGCSEEMLKNFFNIWAGNVYGLILEIWNPEPGVGWAVDESLWGIVEEFFGHDDERVVEYAKECFGSEYFDDEYIKQEVTV